MNLIYGEEKLILLEKHLLYNNEYEKKLLFDKKLLFEKINLILEKDECDLEHNIDSYSDIFEKILCLTNKNYSLDYDSIDILLFFEKKIFELVEIDLVNISYYIEFVTNLPEKFLLTYSNLIRTKKDTIFFLENNYPNESKKLIQIIEKNKNN